MKICGNCSYELYDDMRFCPHCGMAVDETGEARELTKEDLPPKFRPLSAWAYFGYGLLFSLPVAGLVLLIVFSCGNRRNINLRSFARSHFCTLILIAAIVLVLALTGTLGALTAGVLTGSLL